MLLLICSSTAISQNQKEFEKWGDMAADINDYYGAALYYKKALDIDSSNSQLTYKYAEALRGYNDYEKAEYYYHKIYRKDRGRLYPEGPFWLATMMMYNGKYPEAKKLWRKISNNHRRNKSAYEYQKAVQQMKACDSAMVYIHQRQQLEINNIGEPVNSFDAELSPVLDSQGDLYFGSLKGELGKNNEVISKQYHIRIYKASATDDDWHTPQPLDTVINQPMYHTGNPALDASGTLLVYTQCNDSMKCVLKGAEIINGEFVAPREISGDIHIPEYRTTQPSFAQIDGQEYLFFASDRPGGYGKFDLYFAPHFGNLEFGEVRNLGPTINSIDNEITPWYESDSLRLWFSSDWHAGLGGFDVFYSSGSEVNWSLPVNARPPVNSSANDIYYRYYQENNKGFVVSNRAGSLAAKGETCCNDIYVFEYPHTTDTLPEIETLEQLSDYLPVTLYFHNDEPNPRSWDTTTTRNYLDTYTAYRAMLPVYQQEYSEGLKKKEKDAAIENINSFFAEKVDLGVEHLALFTKLLLRELEKGRKIDLTIKGYASPLARSDYNVNLTQRRIQSLVNYLRAYNMGIFIPYIEGTAENGGRLNFTRIPFGAYRAEKSVSDNLHDQRNSVYSRSAALERKIEILSVERAAEDSASAEIYFPSTIHNFGSVAVNDTLVHQFTFTNRGEKPLLISEVSADCSCAEINFPTSEIASQQSGTVRVQFNGLSGEGKYSKAFVVRTNGIPEEVELVVTAEINPEE